MAVLDGAEALNCPLVITLHIQDPGEPHRRNRHSTLYREMISRASRVVAVGRPLELFPHQQISLLSPPQLEIISSGIDLDAVHKISGRRSSPPRTWGRIIGVGNLLPVKGLDLSLKALAELDRWKE
jgi:glycosyltransferase involved in cell wall biosynthesis